MSESQADTRVKIQIYDGFGHSGRLMISGHVLKKVTNPRNRYTANVWHNSLDMLNLFFVKPFPKIKVQLFWNHQVLETITGKDGFFSFEWKSENEVSPGWHAVRVVACSTFGKELKIGEGNVYVPDPTQLGIISDIDDTIMVSHSSRFRKRMREIFLKQSHSRKLFPETGLFYRLLSATQTDSERPNPFFYVSSSEWNLYGYLKEFFRFNDLPNGIFLLSQIKRWFQMLKTGKTNHFGKAERIQKILQTYPDQKFVLLGDNSQADPGIYSFLAAEFPDRLAAVFIRNVRPSRAVKTKENLSLISEKGIQTCFYKDTKEAISFSVQIGLIDESVLKGNV